MENPDECYEVQCEDGKFYVIDHCWKRDPIGPFQSREEAEAERQRLMAEKSAEQEQCCRDYDRKLDMDFNRS